MSVIPDQSHVAVHPPNRCWIPDNQGEEETIRIYCFHPAGGAASLFRGWSKSGLRGAATWALQLPGREGRLREAPYRSMPEAVKEVVDALAEPLGPNDCFFGYSLGALIAFETVRELRRRGRTLPGRLIVAASAAPGASHVRNPTVSMLSDDDLIEEIRRSHTVPKVILDDRDVMKVVLPTIRADFQLLEGYQAAKDDPLPISIVAYGAISDPYVQPFEAAEWGGATTSSFRLRFFVGDHYFLKSAAHEIFDDLTLELGLPRRGTD